MLSNEQALIADLLKITPEAQIGVLITKSYEHLTVFAQLQKQLKEQGETYFEISQNPKFQSLEVTKILSVQDKNNLNDRSFIFNGASILATKNNFYVWDGKWKLVRSKSVIDTLQTYRGVTQLQKPITVALKTSAMSMLPAGEEK